MDQKIKFHKYQGAGNDFILIDNRDKVLNNISNALVKHLCDRRFGIGADGLMLLQNTNELDFEMVYFNSDGREGSMCGNGGRCIVAFARDLGIIKDKTVFLAVDGEHYATIQREQVKLGMTDVNEIQKDGEAYVLHTGSPHYVTKANNLTQLDVYQQGYAIRNNSTYRQDGINVNFVEKEGAGYFLRTFERGVENETYACGTGATAVAMAMAIEEDLNGPLEIPIRALGGQLYVSFEKNGQRFTNVILKGPANFVYEGFIAISL
ncbi:diaminopimelate epimerase [Sphingobacterium paucimobilis]|uniref:Diaminopimelate epimerase n=1 Tax=Sphingobacterium paucimobilis HER1398 TaxID=1346330 RepID=U2HT84_9SPHI|nr:diaminopimelate epimerase [Sphingobacterium paucimobilis]ERJ58490.1 hypothetical protein M472_06895 [Sphingobacterium paucimobilis HER1398]